MLSVLLALAIGQVVETATSNTSAVIVRTSDGLSIMADSTGKRWSSPDLVWLRKFIAMKNAEYREAAQAEAAKAADLAAGKSSRPPSNPPVSPPAAVGQLPTGVASNLFPSVQPGGSWYGGNVTAPAGGHSGHPIGATEDAGPVVHLTVIGAAPERQAVLDGLRRDPTAAAMLETMGDRLAIQDYDPTDPMVAGVGLPAGGRPDVVIQNATGKVLYRSRSDPGPAVIVAEIRRADPDYDPAKDPSGGFSLDFFSDMKPADLACVAAVVGFLVLAVAWKGPHQ